MIDQTKTNYFNALTGVRAIAAYMVFFHHFNPFSAGIFGSRIALFVNEFHVGVTFFFVLSGFLIGYRYMDLEKFRFRNYMVNRFARIYPMYFMLTTVTFLLASDSEGNGMGVYLANISFLKGFSDQLKFTGIAQGWSLTVEETFYLLAPLVFFLIKKNWRAMLLLPLFFFSIGLALVALFRGGGNFGIFGSYDFMIIYTFFGRVFEFFVGIGLAIVIKRDLFIMKKNFLTYLGLSVTAICILAMSLVKGDLPIGILHPIGMVINNVLLPLFGISIFYLGLLRERTIVSRILETRLFVLLGKSSYIFYLIHAGVIATVVSRWSGNYLLNFVLLNLLSVLLFHYLEEPLNLFLRRKLNRQQVSAK
jgi:peptidoglycan/LPS O-acetylase OafA/YrhL